MPFTSTEDAAPSSFASAHSDSAPAATASSSVTDKRNNRFEAAALHEGSLLSACEAYLVAAIRKLAVRSELVRRDKKVDRRFRRAGQWRHCAEWETMPENG